MPPDGSLDEYMNTVVKRYSSLFTLPSQKKLILSLSMLCVFGGGLAFLSLAPSHHGFVLGLIFGATFFFIVVSSDLIVTYSCMKTDPVFNLRRCFALSFFSSLLWFGFIFVGSIVSVFLGSTNIWIKFLLLGFCAALISRLVVLSTASFANRRGVFISSLLQPALCIAPIFFMAPIITYNLTSLTIFFSLSISVAFLTVFLFTFLLDRVGKRTLGIPSLSLFKAFLANWTEDLNMPLESLLEKLGEERDIRLSLLAFKGDEKAKAVVVVPESHPGPFKNVGSSLLPYMIQEALENKLQCVASVPHGLFGHDFDLSSQLQSQKVVEGVLSCMDFSFVNSEATPLMRIRKNGASASCQIFGNCAFLTLTVAPKSMEDLPRELDSIIVGEAEKRGLSLAIVVDAHNSIDGPFKLDEAVKSLRKVAMMSLEEALSVKRSSFEVGAAKVIPKEFSVKEGMGPGGISVIVARVGDQKTAYVTIDGNNMISGLREKILSMFKEIGIDDGEVLTTDTHVVNGVVLTPRGYHPIGEVMDHGKVIGYVRQAAMEALNNLEPAEVSWCIGSVPNVKVIGKKPIEALCLLADETMKKAKRLAVPLFLIAGVLFVSLLLLL